jgi:hypothetical protein
MKYFLLPLLALLAQPALAEMAFVADELLANPDTALAGALVACATGVTDPDAADAAFLAAGWEKMEGEGSWDYAHENLTVMMWTVPGFCMVDAPDTSTDAMAETFLGLSGNPPDETTDADGCRAFLLDDTITATLNGPGNDPACTSDTGAAMRFEAEVQ